MKKEYFFLDVSQLFNIFYDLAYGSAKKFYLKLFFHAQSHNILAGQDSCDIDSYFLSVCTLSYDDVNSSLFNPFFQDSCGEENETSRAMDWDL